MINNTNMVGGHWDYYFFNGYIVFYGSYSRPEYYTIKENYCNYIKTKYEK